MKKVLYTALLMLFTLTASAQTVVLDCEGRDSTYVETIKSRAQKIVDGLQLNDKQTARNVRNIIANRYFLLNDIHSKFHQIFFGHPLLIFDTSNLYNIGFYYVDIL